MRLMRFLFLVTVFSFSGSFCSAKAEDLLLPATGVWNGFLGHVNVVECSNLSSEPLELKLYILDSQDRVMGTAPMFIPALGTQHTILNGFNIADRYGTYIIDLQSGGDTSPKLSCLTSVYRMAPSTGAKKIDYAFVLPVRNAIRGNMFGMYNSFNPDGGSAPVYNWLTVYNTGHSVLKARVQTRLVSGQIDTSQSPGIMQLSPGQRMDVALGHPAGQRVGMFEIVPEDKDMPYGAFLTRYSPTKSGSFNFAFPVFAQAGLCDSGLIPASTMDPAINWGEIGNTTGTPLSVSIEVRNSAGALVHSEISKLDPHSQKHLYLNQFLGARKVGTFRVRCTDSPASAPHLIVQSLFYGKLDNSSAAIEWGYVSQSRGPLSGETVTAAVPVNTFLGASNWLKVFNGSTYRETVYVPIYSVSGDAIRNSLSPVYVEPGGSADLAMHSQVGPDFIGQAYVVPFSVYPNISTEIIRVFPHKSGKIGYIMNIPNALVEGYEGNYSGY